MAHLKVSRSVSFGLWVFGLSVSFVLSAPSFVKSRDDLDNTALEKLMNIAANELDEGSGKKKFKARRPSGSSILAAHNKVKVIVMRSGRVLGSATAANSSLPANTRLAAWRAVRKLQGLGEDFAVAGVDIILEIFLPERRLRPVNPLLVEHDFDAGREGLRLVFAEYEINISATDIILAGRGFKRLLFARYKEADRQNNIRKFFLPTTSFYALPSVVALRRAKGKTLRLFRGGRLFKLSELNVDAIDKALKLARDWYLNNQNPDHSPVYIYLPTQDKYSNKGQLLIRQFFGVATIGSLQSVITDVKLKSMGQEILKWLFDKYYREHPNNNTGYIVDGGKISLGNAAGALIAILRLGELKNYRAQAERLYNFIDAMRRPDNSYVLHPEKPKSNRGINYYPGEAQLALLEYYKQDPIQVSTSGVLFSFQYYARYFKKNLHTPFIPWHTQADVLLYEITRRRAVAEFVFIMNDFLLAAQQLGKGFPADCRGRFFNIEKRKSGYDHVSSTGVYLEGLLDAFKLARAMGDRKREQNYRKAILWGLRNILQLQVRDELDTWFMPAPRRALGGFRTRKDNAEIRIDNLQHCVNALVKARQILRPEDYATATLKN